LSNKKHTRKITSSWRRFIWFRLNLKLLIKKDGNWSQKQKY